MMDTNEPIAKVWAFSGGHIPLRSTGDEPRFTSHDKVAILNPSNEDARIKVTIFYADQQPVDGYELEVKACRIRKIRLNDLVDPLPIPLDTPYGFVFKSNVGVVIQFSRAITSDAAATGFCITPYAAV